MRPGFIFTTALPPAICSAATAAIRHLKTSNWERERHQDRAARVKAILTAAGLPVMSSDTHIVPLFVGDPEHCKRACDILLEEHSIYIQPINYPTVAKGTERLRITPSPYHDDGADRSARRGAAAGLGAARPAASGKIAGGRISRYSLPSAKSRLLTVAPGAFAGVIRLYFRPSDGSSRAAIQAARRTRE